MNQNPIHITVDYSVATARLRTAARRDVEATNGDRAAEEWKTELRDAFLEYAELEWKRHEREGRTIDGVCALNPREHKGILLLVERNQQWIEFSFLWTKKDESGIELYVTALEFFDSAMRKLEFMNHG